MSAIYAGYATDRLLVSCFVAAARICNSPQGRIASNLPGENYYTSIAAEITL
jgi:hypothetical protein